MSSLNIAARYKLFFLFDFDYFFALRGNHEDEILNIVLGSENMIVVLLLFGLFFYIIGGKHLLYIQVKTN